MDVAKFREWHFRAPEDYELLGEEMFNGRRCHLLESRAAQAQLLVGVADGRLYGRKWFSVYTKHPDYNELEIMRRIGGAKIKTESHWWVWLQKKPNEMRHARRELAIAEFEFCRVRRIEAFDDYREVAPDCWLPFRLVDDSFEYNAAEPFPDGHVEFIVVDVQVNQPLPDELFQLKLEEGTTIQDQRYEALIEYPYRKLQTEDERLVLVESAKQRHAKYREEVEKNRGIDKSLVGQSPPAFPKTGWIRGSPLNWEMLRGKVVVLHFFDANQPDYRREQGRADAWNDSSADTADTRVVVIGIHPPSSSAEQVQKELAKNEFQYPILLDSPPVKPTGVGLLHEWFGNVKWPNTVVVDKLGKIAYIGEFEDNEIWKLMAKESKTPAKN